MNNFNPDQNPHILSSLETQEGGAGGGNVPANQAETEFSREVLEGQSYVNMGDGYSLENALGDLVYSMSKDPPKYSTQ